MEGNEEEEESQHQLRDEQHTAIAGREMETQFSPEAGGLALLVGRLQKRRWRKLSGKKRLIAAYKEHLKSLFVCGREREEEEGQLKCMFDDDKEGGRADQREREARAPQLRLLCQQRNR